MSKFYGVVTGQAKTSATRRGSAKSGMTTTCASWHGAVEVYMFDDNGTIRYTVSEIPWQGAGKRKHIAHGVLGE